MILPQVQLRNERIKIVTRNVFFAYGGWWVTVYYSDGGEDCYGPFEDETKAEGLIF